MIFSGLGKVQGLVSFDYPNCVYDITQNELSLSTLTWPVLAPNWLQQDEAYQYCYELYNDSC